MTRRSTPLGVQVPSGYLVRSAAERTVIRRAIIAQGARQMALPEPGYPQRIARGSHIPGHLRTVWWPAPRATHRPLVVGMPDPIEGSYGVPCGDLRAGLTLVQLVEPGWRLGPAPPDHWPRGVGGEREPLQVPQQCGGSLFHDLTLRFGRNVVPYVAVGVWVPHATNELRVIRGPTPCIAGPTRYTSARWDTTIATS